MNSQYLMTATDRAIFSIAVPSIVSNVAVPLLSLVDTAIVGHLGAAAYIGAIAVGGMVFNMLYWLFGFLRMGTGGLTAQAYGAGHSDECCRTLVRSLSVAVLIASIFILTKCLLIDVVFDFVQATPDVEALARIYFNILIWGAPAVMGLYSFVGWFLGMQNARFPMYVSVAQNVINILVSLFLVVGLHWRIEGVATGTLVAQYAGLFMAIAFCARRYGSLFFRRAIVGTFNRMAFVRFFSVNRDIFLRTLCMVGVMTCFTTVGTALGELTLAANALLMQFFVFFSYVMDGFAYAGESIGGRCVGARSRCDFNALTRRLFVCGIWLAVGFTLVYAVGGTSILSLLTDEASVIDFATRLLPYAIALPFVSFSAFLFDGLFIGATATRQMLYSMAGAAAIYFALLWALPAGAISLWIAFLAYLGGRGGLQAWLYRGVVRHTFTTA